MSPTKSVGSTRVSDKSVDFVRSGPCSGIWHGPGQTLSLVDCVVHCLSLLAVWWQGTQSARDSHILACNGAKYSLILIFFSLADCSNKPFLIWLLKIPPHLKYVATLPCNSSLIACSLTLMFHKVVWQHNARCGGILNNDFTANLIDNQPVKKF